MWPDAVLVWKFSQKPATQELLIGKIVGWLGGSVVPPADKPVYLIESRPRPGLRIG